MKALMLSLLALSLNAQAAGDRTITVSGQCLTHVAPDRGRVTLVATFKDKSSQVASKKAMETYEKIRQAVIKMKLKDVELQTSEYTVQDDIVYGPNGRGTVKGKVASLGLQVVTSEISRLGDIIALSSQYNIQRVEDLQTFLSREKTKTAQESCLVEAIKNARGKAEKMSAAANTSVGEVQLIDENPNSAVGYVNNAKMLMADSATAEESIGARLAPGIESRPETIAVNVLVKFALK